MKDAVPIGIDIPARIHLSHPQQSCASENIDQRSLISGFFECRMTRPAKIFRAVLQHG